MIKDVKFIPISNTWRSVMESIKKRMAAEYARDALKKSFQKHGTPLNFEQWESMCSQMSKATSILRLVANSASHGGAKDLQVAVELALNELNQVRISLNNMTKRQAKKLRY